MKKYKIKIIETLEKTVMVNADNVEDAIRFVDDRYRAADKDYILCADNFTDVEFKIEDETE